MKKVLVNTQWICNIHVQIQGFDEYTSWYGSGPNLLLIKESGSSAYFEPYLGFYERGSGLNLK